MKFLIIQVFVSLSLSQAMAGNIGTICRNASVEDCEIKVELALERASCVNTEATSCQELTDAEGVDRIFCYSKNVKGCSSPKADLFGLSHNSVYCRDNANKVNLTRIDSDITLDWSFGLFNTFVRHICVGE